MLAAAFVVITATVSFQHDTPPQAAYADPGDFLFNINYAVSSLSSLRDDDGYVIDDMISNPKKGPMGIAFNSTGWMFVVNNVPGSPDVPWLCDGIKWADADSESQCEKIVEEATDEQLQAMYEYEHTISIYDPDGNHVKTIGSVGIPDTNRREYYLCKLYDPDRINKSNWKNSRCWVTLTDIAVDANDNIYVTNRYSKYQVLIYDPNWEFIKHINVVGSVDAYVPYGIDVGGPNNYVYTAHQISQAITVFDPHVDDPGKAAELVYMIGNHADADLKFDDFKFSLDVAVDDSTGRIFATSGLQGNSRTHIFDPVTDPSTGKTTDYVFVKNIDFDFRQNPSLMVMNDPHPLSPNENSLFVVDRGAPRGSLVVFDNDGENPQQFKFYRGDFEHINPTHGFRTPFGVAVHPLTNQIMVSINGYNTIVVLGPGSPSGSSSNNNNNKGGSNDFDFMDAPTFGLSHDSRLSSSRLIDSGISLNGFALDVGSFHTEFARQILQTGQDNTLSAKVLTGGAYGGLKIIEFFYGVPRIGALSQAEGSIEVHLNPYDREEFPEITDIAIHDDRHSLLLQGNTTATVQRADCIKGDAKKGCYKVDIGFVFANAPVGEVFALQATDSRGWSTTEYFNDGFEVQGAPLIPVTMSIAADLARGAGKGSTEVTQIDRKKDLWLSADDNTTLYTKNDFGFWKKLTPDKPLNRCSEDAEYDTKEWNVMTRMHCLHGAQTESEAKRAKSVFNSSAIQKELPDSFAHEPPLAIDHRSALLHRLGWITTDDVIKRLELSSKYDHMDGQQLKDEVHQLLLLEDGDADAVDADADTGAAALVTPGSNAAVINKINSEIHFLKEQFNNQSLILAQIHSALADLSDGLTQQKQELEMHDSKIDALWSDKNSSNESELLEAMLQQQQQQQQQQHALLYFLPLLSAALTAVPCLFYFRRHAKAKTKTVQAMTGEQQQLKNYDDDNNDTESQLQQMQQELEEKHQEMQHTQHERLQQTQQKLEELQESKQKMKQELEEKHQEQQNTPADLSNNAEIYKKIDELLNQTKRK